MDKTRRPFQLNASSLSLADVLYVQEKLQGAMGYPCGTGEEGLKQHALAMIDEVMETLHEVNWKPWKRHRLKKVDREAVLVELCDQLQFWGNQVNAMGFTAEEVTTMLSAKWEVGFQRIDDGEVTRAEQG